MKRIRPLQLLIAFGSLAMTAAYAGAQGAPPTPTVSSPSSFAVSPPLSDLPSSPLVDPSTLKIRARHPLPPRGVATDNNAADAALQTAAGPHLDVEQQPNFPGIGENGYLPPDPNIAVGPNNIVQVVNVEIAVFNKSGVVASGYPKTLSSLWSNLGGGCASNNSGDPIVQYDKLADRFIVTQLGSLSSPYSECIAVSTTNDPRGSYYLYSYSFGSNLNDYPKFGIWPTSSNAAYLATYNLFASGNSFVGADLCAYDRSAMLSGFPATQVCFTISGDGGFLPADLDGSTPPSELSPGYFLNFETTSSLRLYQLFPNFTTPSSSTLSLVTPDLTVTSFTEACNGGTCIPQPGTSKQLDSLGDRLMYRLAYRHFSDHESLVVNHSVANGSSVGVRWYELQKTTGAFGVYQQSTFAPDSTYRWMGSIAMDAAGDMALGYSASSSSVYPSLNYTGRIATTTPLNTMAGETTMQAGNGSQTGYSRWGDYSSMRIDPSDDCTFWYTNEYYTATSSYVWSTAIGSFLLNSACTASPDFGIWADATPLTLAPGQATSSGSVSVTALNGFTSNVSLTLAGCPANATCSLPSSVTPSATSSLSISTTSSTPTGSYPIAITGTGGGLTHTSSFTLVVSNFSISASPSSLTVKRRLSGSSIVSVSGASGTATLSVSGLPPKTSASFSSNPVTIPGSSTLTIKVSPNASTGTFTLTITANNGSTSVSTPLSLTIQ